MRAWNDLLVGAANPFGDLTSGLRKITLDDGAYHCALEADSIRRGQKTLDQPNLYFLRAADCLEFSGKIMRLLSLDEDRARAFLEKLKVKHG